jgi:putative transposase
VLWVDRVWSTNAPPCGNGPDLVTQVLQRFCENKVGLLYIPPGTPWNNGYIESFNNRLRKECLNRNHWNTQFEARVVN